MGKLLGIVFIVAILACAVVGIGVATGTLPVMARSLLLAFAATLYLVPSVVALRRNCAFAAGIVVLDLLFGWTLYGWVIALGWAASGETEPAKA